MSITYLTTVFNHYDGPAPRKLVLLLLADHAEDTSGWAHPWIRQLSSRACMDDSSVRKHLKQLIETDRVLEVVRKGGRVWNAGSRKFTNEPTVWRIREEVLLQLPSLRLRGRKTTPMPGIDCTGDDATPSTGEIATTTDFPHSVERGCGLATPSTGDIATPPCSNSTGDFATLRDRQDLNVKDLSSYPAETVDNTASEHQHTHEPVNHSKAVSA